jgi:RNA polymerase sigma factor (sigma-70 family)
MAGNNKNSEWQAALTVESDPASDEAEVLALINQCKEGDPDALHRFFQIYGEDIYNFPIRVFNMDIDEAGDFFLFAFERLRDGRRMKTFVGDSKFRTWLYTVLRNLVIDWLRSRRELDLIPVDRIEKEEKRSEADPAGGDELSGLLFRKLEQLPVLHRVVFKLVYLYYIDLTDADVAFLTGEYGLTAEEILHFVMSTRSELADREEENLKKEDSLTHLYLSIYRLKERRERLLADASRPRKEIEAEIERIELALNKKYATRNRILERKRKGLLVARVPYRKVASFLKIPEGSVSVYMGKVASFLTNDVELKKFF